MSFAAATRFIAGTILVFVLSTQPASAQASLGFENPDDISNLLEYRLPDWGYRTWDLGFSLGGSGGDSYHGDEQQSASNTFRTELNSLFTLYRESEQRTYRLYVDGSGNYRRTHASSQDREVSGHNLDGDFVLGGNWTRYLGDGPFSFRVGGNTRQLYSESIQESRNGQITEESRHFGRSHHYSLNLGAGLGRVRDVTPLIRAQRLSERLTALGRKPLAPDQVKEIARVLATEEGYRAIYDRPEKDFWRDVLQPMLDPEQPLSPFEVFYLREIMEEDVGPRGQGSVLRASFVYFDNEKSGDQNESHDIKRGPALDYLWVKNLSLDHQLSLGAGADYSWTSVRGGNREDVATAGIDLAYLWTIADRYRWDTDLTLDGIYEEYKNGEDLSIQRNLATGLSSVFTVYIQNTISLNFRVNGSNLQENHSYNILAYQERYSRRWNWSYGIGLKYLLDRVLY